MAERYRKNTINNESVLNYYQRYRQSTINNQKHPRLDYRSRGYKGHRRKHQERIDIVQQDKKRKRLVW